MATEAGDMRRMIVGPGRLRDASADLPFGGTTEVGSSHVSHYAANSKLVAGAQPILMATYGRPGDSSAGVGISTNESSPWWATRLVDVAPVIETEYTKLGHTAETLNIEWTHAEPSSGPMIGLDFGSNITFHAGTIVDYPTYWLSTEAYGYGIAPEADDSWLAPDADVESASAEPPDVEWNEPDDDTPALLELSSVKYRGGGLMARHRRSDSSD